MFGFLVSQGQIQKDSRKKSKNQKNQGTRLIFNFLKTYPKKNKEKDWFSWFLGKFYFFLGCFDFWKHRSFWLQNWKIPAFSLDFYFWKESIVFFGSFKVWPWKAKNPNTLSRDRKNSTKTMGDPKIHLFEKIRFRIHLQHPGIIKMTFFFGVHCSAFRT